MFTGIIEGTGVVSSLKKTEEGAQITIESHFDLERLNIGDSIAANGCCLTVTSRLGNKFWADLSSETLALTTFGHLQEGAALNLERPLKIGGRLGGHIVQGHIDGVGKVIGLEPVGESKELTIQVSQSLSRFLLKKGSVAVDGISLTVNCCNKESFKVMIIPHTQLKTTVECLKIGDFVNLEVDIVGKYVEKLTHLDSGEYQTGSKITQEFLKKHGF